METINKFDGEYAFLSNFYPARITIDDITYPTVEHAFQAMKTFNIDDRISISEASTPGKSKRLGRRVKLRDDWEDVKISIMKDLVRQKFTRRHSTIGYKLLDTGDTLLIEGNNWDDTFWGVCKDKGENNLGKILMEIREELKTLRSYYKV